MPTKLKSTGVEFPDGSTQTSAASGAPSGALQYFAMDTAPDGWLKANGAEVSRSTYSDLFSAIGTTFGAGDGSTTFELPDLRGEFLRGWDDGRGVDSGRSFGSAQLDQMQRITGGFEGSRLFEFQPNVLAGAFVSRSTAGRQRSAGSGSSTKQGFNFDSSESPDARTSTSTDGETRARNVALLACIKY